MTWPTAIPLKWIEGGQTFDGWAEWTVGSEDSHIPDDLSFVIPVDSLGEKMWWVHYSLREGGLPPAPFIYISPFPSSIEKYASHCESNHPDRGCGWKQLVDLPTEGGTE